MIPKLYSIILIWENIVITKDSAQPNKTRNFFNHRSIFRKLRAITTKRVEIYQLSLNYIGTVNNYGSEKLRPADIIFCFCALG